MALLVPIVCCWYPARACAQGAATHTVVTLTMHFDASASRTTAAFGPLSEAQWAPDFQPHFAYPDPPAQVAGAVFTTSKHQLWLLHDYDPAAGLVQYVIVDPSSEVATLTIRAVTAASGSDVTMTYDIVALGEAGSAHAAAIQRHARDLAAHMQHAVGAYLEAGGR